MSAQKQQFVSPLLRLVQGHPMEKQDKNMQGQPLTTKTGQPTQRYFMAGAIAKNDPAWPTFYGMLVAVARGAFPHLFNAQGQCTHPKFSWKVIDGDSVDDNGKPNRDKPGFAGCYVIKFQSSFPPRCFYQGKHSPQEEIRDPNVIPRGYYVRVAGTIEGNGDANKPGLYVNLGLVELCAQGEVINTGADPSAVFGAAAAPALPAGAMALPGMPGVGSPTGFQPGAFPAMPGGFAVAAPAPAMAPAAPMMPGTQPAMPGMPAAFPGAAVAPAFPVAPNPAFAAGPGAMPAPPAPPAPPPAGPQLTPAALAAFPGGTLANWQAGGWTEATMRAGGYIV